MKSSQLFCDCLIVDLMRYMKFNGDWHVDRHRKFSLSVKLKTLQHFTNFKSKIFSDNFDASHYLYTGNGELSLAIPQ